MAQLPSVGAESVFMEEEWKLGLEIKTMISGVVLEFEIFGAYCFQASPCKQRSQLCAVAYENSSFSMCDPTRRQGSWGLEEDEGATSLSQDGHETPVLRGL